MILSREDIPVACQGRGGIAPFGLPSKVAWHDSKQGGYPCGLSRA